MSRPAMCAHCGVDPVDDAQPETRLCPHCLDLAVWGATCDECDEVPATGRRARRCQA